MRKLLLLLLLAQSASAEPRTFFTWTTEDGVVGFTDNQKQIPPKYLDTLKYVQIDGLQDYSRGTIRSDDGEYARGLTSRLSHLRSLR